MASSPLRERRNRDVLLTCIRCGSAFHPFKGFEETAQYCSRACNSADNREKLAALRASGKDPAHGGDVLLFKTYSDSFTKVP